MVHWIETGFFIALGFAAAYVMIWAIILGIASIFDSW
jgi:hypothetical protein